MKGNDMIAIPCHNCSHMVDIDINEYPDLVIGSTILMCPDCTEEYKINERNKKLNKVLKRGLVERVKSWLSDL